MASVSPTVSLEPITSMTKEPFEEEVPKPFPGVFPEPVLKRPFDFLLSGAGLLVFSPLWLVISLAIWLEDRGPVFFTQQRVGRNGKLFKALKFRSMRIAQNTVEVQAQKNDPRMTRVGRFLRRTALDELPQILNIFRGDMSFVGPRSQPQRERVRHKGREIDLVISEVPGFELRQMVRPGLTGMAQIYASREVAHRDKFRYDRIYVQTLMERSGLTGELSVFWLDLRLIFLSAWNTLRARWEA